MSEKKPSDEAWEAVQMLFKANTYEEHELALAFDAFAAAAVGTEREACSNLVRVYEAPDFPDERILDLAADAILARGTGKMKNTEARIAGEAMTAPKTPTQREDRCEWLDAPDADGWWWHWEIHGAGLPELDICIVQVIGNHFYFGGRGGVDLLNHKLGSTSVRWRRVAPPERANETIAQALADARAEGIRESASYVLNRSNAMMVDREFTAEGILELLDPPLTGETK